MIEPIQPSVLPPSAPLKSAPADKPVVITDSFRTDQTPDMKLMKPMSFRTEGATKEVPRPMSDDEKADFHSWFPKLDVDKAVVTAEATPRYNCISWSSGNSKSWDWPPNMYPDQGPVEAFSTYYTERGFTPISAEDAAALPPGSKELVAYWEDPNGPTHGSVSGPTHGDRWESKCGQAARIQHERDGLVSDVYGEIKGYWLKTGPSTVADPPEVSSEVTRQIRDKVDRRLAAVQPEVKDKFAQAYGEWQALRHDPKVAMSSDPASYCRGEGFQKLVKLGPEALPLLLDKMQQGDHFCQYVAQAVSKQRSGIHTMGAPSNELKAHRVNLGEQDKAQQVMEQYLNSSW